MEPQQDQAAAKLETLLAALDVPWERLPGDRPQWRLITDLGDIVCFQYQGELHLVDVDRTQADDCDSTVLCAALRLTALAMPAKLSIEEADGRELVTVSAQLPASRIDAGWLETALVTMLATINALPRGGERSSVPGQAVEATPQRLDEPTPGSSHETHGFIAVLADGYLVPASDGTPDYIVVGQASGKTMCRVDPATAHYAATTPSETVFLGYWEGTFRGLSDVWRIWHSRGVPWASTSDVEDATQAEALVRSYELEMQRTGAMGTAFNPSPPAPDPKNSQPQSRARQARGNLGSGLAKRAGLSLGAALFGRRRRR